MIEVEALVCTEELVYVACLVQNSDKLSTV